MDAVRSRTNQRFRVPRSAGYSSLPVILFALLAGLLVQSSYFNSLAALRSQNALRQALDQRSEANHEAIGTFTPIPKSLCRLLGQTSPDPGLTPRVCKSGVSDKNDTPLLDYNQIFASVAVCPTDTCHIPARLTHDHSSTGNLAGVTVKPTSASVRFLASLRGVQIDSLHLDQPGPFLIVAAENISIGNIVVNSQGDSTILLYSIAGGVSVGRSSPKIIVAAKAAQGVSLPSGTRTRSVKTDLSIENSIFALVP